jgi:hypothetical protein
MSSSTAEPGAASTALVGPLPSVRFRDGTVLPADPPHDTCDPRWAACAEHRTACDCREAELNEDRAEYRAMYQAVIDAAANVLAGHPTNNFNRDEPDGSIRDTGCMCTGCRIVRASFLPLTQAGIRAQWRSRFEPATDRSGESVWFDDYGDIQWRREGDHVPDGWRRLYVKPVAGGGEAT